MLKLHHVLYIAEPDITLKLDGGAVLACHADGQEDRIPLHLLQGIVSFSHIPPTQALAKTCAWEGIGFVIFSENGRFQYRIVGASRGNVLLRKRQYLLSEDTAGRLELARVMIQGKILGAAGILHRYAKNHQELADLTPVKGRLKALAGLASTANEETYLRGIEGIAAKEYFNVFDRMLRTSDPAFSFAGRSRRPPKDPCNALLSFTYTLLMMECVNALEGVGLDPCVGFLHGDRPGKESLALDMMEELRPMVADRFVLRLINLQMIRADQFVPVEEDGVHLSPEGRRLVLREWSKMRQREVRLAEYDQTAPLGLLPFLQAQKLARFLRGECPAYTNVDWGTIK